MGCEAVIKALAEKGHTVINDTDAKDVIPSEDILKNSHADLVIVGGGDGSVNIALSGLMKTKIPLLVLPLGTANNLARSYELPTDLAKCIDLIDTGKIAELDVGLVNDLPFINVAGMGLSTEINEKTPSKLKRSLGVLAFIITGIRTLKYMNPFRLVIEADGKTVHSKSWQISVCNGRHYGAGMVIHEDASHEDKRLHLLSTEVDRWWKAITLFPAFMMGKYEKHHEVTLLEAKEITLKTRRTFKIDVDGDIKTETPAKFSVVPKALRMLVTDIK